MAYDAGNGRRLTTSSSPVGSNEPLTISCWFYPTSAAQENNLLSVTSSTTVSGWYLNLDNGTPNLRARKLAGGATVQAWSTGAANLNAWNFAAGVFTSDTSRTVYLNDETGNTDATSRADTTDTINQITMGEFHATQTGRIAEVAIWNAALSAGDMKALSQGISPQNVRPTSLVFYAPLIRDLTNSFVTSRAITNTGGATVVVHPRIYR